MKEKAEKPTEKKARRKQLSRKEYEKLNRTAYEYVVVQGFDQKEVAQLLKISEQTISDWSKKGKWREMREARQQCVSTDADNTKKLLKLMSTQRLELEESITEAIKIGDKEEEARLRKQASSLSDEMSKVNKTLQSLDKGNHALGTYIDIMDEIFSSLRKYDEDLWTQTFDFQTKFVREITNKLG